ncbi:MAG: RNA polymerase sigma factor [Spirochaetales bacterium]|nr:RNA polymerase sigma factor [Spirochaetales bacterium]
MEFTGDFVKQLKNRDRPAFEKLYHATKDRIYRYILFKVCGNTHAAEDILSEVYCDAIRYAPSLVSGRHIQAWLYRIAGSKIADHFRRHEARKRNFNFYDLPGSDFSEVHDTKRNSPETELLEDENRLFIAAVLAKLPEEYRNILTGKYLDDLSVEKIAVQTGKSAKSVESMLFRARKLFIREYQRMSRESRYSIPEGGES